MPSYQRINAANVTRGPRGYKKIRHLSSTMIEGKFPLQKSDIFCIFVGINPDSATQIGKCWSSECIMFRIWWIGSLPFPQINLSWSLNQVLPGHNDHRSHVWPPWREEAPETPSWTPNAKRFNLWLSLEMNGKFGWLTNWVLKLLLHPLHVDTCICYVHVRVVYSCLLHPKPQRKRMCFLELN